MCASWHTDRYIDALRVRGTCPYDSLLYTPPTEYGTRDKRQKRVTKWSLLRLGHIWQPTFGDGQNAEEEGVILQFLADLFGSFVKTSYFCGITKCTACADKRDRDMATTEDRYISLLTDFGFKRIFGTAPNKDLLINFLNSLFNGEQVVKDVKYLNTEHFGDGNSTRKAIFDVYCEGEDGEKFIVEMQNAYQQHFKDRSVFYSTFPIREQALKGSDWDFNLSRVYTIALLNFNMKEESFDKDEITHTVKLCDIKTNKVFYKKLDFIYVEIARFQKKEEELETLYDKWLYVLKNLYKLESRPQALRDKVFDRLFKEAEIAAFTPEELREYEDSLKAYRDIKNSIETARREGLEKGRAEGLEKGRAEGLEKGRAEGLEKGRAEGLEKGRAEGEKSKSVTIARKMKEKGFPASEISEVTGLAEEEIEAL